MIYLGIDPGLDGALAAIRDGEEPDTGAPPTVEFVDTPTLTIVSARGKRREYALPNLLAAVRKIAGSTQWSRLHAAIEQVHAMPRQGVRSMFTMGYGVGVWEAILAAEAIPFDRVSPQRWKRAMLDGMGKDKDASRVRALQLFPSAARSLDLKKHHGRAEALLLADFLRRHMSTGQTQ